MSHQVFISFSSKDRDVADRICGDLERRDIPCWISSRNVPPGMDFQAAIVDALKQTKIMILVFSSQSNNSDEVKRELVLAGQYGLLVIPVRIENVLPTGAMEYQLTTRQYLDLFENWDANIEKVADTIRQYVAGEAVVAGSQTNQAPPQPAPDSQPKQPKQKKPLGRVRAALIPVLTALLFTIVLGTVSEKARMAGRIPAADLFGGLLVVAWIACLVWLIFRIRRALRDRRVAG